MMGVLTPEVYNMGGHCQANSEIYTKKALQKDEIPVFYDVDPISCLTFLNYLHVRVVKSREVLHRAVSVLTPCSVIYTVKHGNSVFLKCLFRVLLDKFLV